MERRSERGVSGGPLRLCPKVTARTLAETLPLVERQLRVGPPTGAGARSIASRPRWPVSWQVAREEAALGACVEPLLSEHAAAGVYLGRSLGVQRQRQVRAGQQLR